MAVITLKRVSCSLVFALIATKIGLTYASAIALSVYLFSSILSYIDGRRTLFIDTEYRFSTKLELTPERPLDQELAALQALILRDFVFSWYNPLSGNYEFPRQIEEVVEAVFTSLTSRLQNFDGEQLFCFIVQLFCKHISLFRTVRQQLHSSSGFGVSYLGLAFEWKHRAVNDRATECEVVTDHISSVIQSFARGDCQLRTLKNSKATSEILADLLCNQLVWLVNYLAEPDNLFQCVEKLLGVILASLSDSNPRPPTPDLELGRQSREPLSDSSATTPEAQDRHSRSASVAVAARVPKPVPRILSLNLREASPRRNAVRLASSQDIEDSLETPMAVVNSSAVLEASGKERSDCVFSEADGRERDMERSNRDSGYAIVGRSLLASEQKLARSGSVALDRKRVIRRASLNAEPSPGISPFVNRNGSISGTSEAFFDSRLSLDNISEGFLEDSAKSGTLGSSGNSEHSGATPDDDSMDLGILNEELAHNIVLERQLVSSGELLPEKPIFNLEVKKIKTFFKQSELFPRRKQYSVYEIVYESIEQDDTSYSPGEVCIQHTTRVAYRRFREFLALHDRLAHESNRRYDDILDRVQSPYALIRPYTPYNPAILEKRRKTLETYLQHLCSHTATCNSFVLKQFLGYGQYSVNNFEESGSYEEENVLEKLWTAAKDYSSLFIPRPDHPKANTSLSQIRWSCEPVNNYSYDHTPPYETMNCSASFATSYDPSHPRSITGVCTARTGARTPVQTSGCADDPILSLSRSVPLALNVLHLLETLLDTFPYSVLRRQFLESMTLHLVGSRLNQLLQHCLAQLFSGNSMSAYLGLLRNTLWPRGRLITGAAEPRSEQQKQQTEKHVKDQLNQLICIVGRKAATAALARRTSDEIVESFKDSDVNKHIIYHLIDEMFHQLLRD